LSAKRDISIQNIVSLLIFNTVMSLAFAVYNVQVVSLLLDYFGGSNTVKYAED
jgi:hypothetical protein